MERGILTFNAASLIPLESPGVGAFLRRNAACVSQSHNSCRQLCSINPTSNSRNNGNTISGRSRGNLSLKALKHSLSSNWDVSSYAAPSWLPRFDELDTTNMLLRQRIIFLGSLIDDMTADFVISQLLLLDSEDNKKDIKLFINSPGGSVTAGFGIYDAMKLCKAEISTVCMGLAGSVCAFLLASGAKGKRFCMPNARVLIYETPGYAGGSLPEFSIRVREMYYHKNKMTKILSRITGKPEQQIDEDTRLRTFMNGWEAKDYGLVDAVIDDGKPGLVAPIADGSPPPPAKSWEYWYTPETSRRDRDRDESLTDFPSEEKLFSQNGYALGQGNDEDKGSEQKEEAATSTPA